MLKYLTSIILLISVFCLTIDCFVDNGDFIRPVNLQAPPPRNHTVAYSHLATRANTFNIDVSGTTVGTCSYTWNVGTSVTFSCTINSYYCMMEAYVYLGNTVSPPLTSYTTHSFGCTNIVTFTENAPVGAAHLYFAAKIRHYFNTNVGGPLSQYQIFNDPNSNWYILAKPTPPGSTQYPANCIDFFNHISINYNSQPMIYTNCSAYSYQDPNVHVHYSNISSVNWIINQKLKGTITNGYQTVQYVIWLLMHPGESVPVPQGWYLDYNKINTLLTNAMANSNWVPTGPNDYDSIIVYCGDTVQDTMYHAKRSTLIDYEQVSTTSTVGSIKISGYVYSDCIFNDVLETSPPATPVADQQIQISLGGVDVVTVTTNPSGYYTINLEVPVNAGNSYLLTLVQYSLTPRVTQKYTGALSDGATFTYNFLMFDTTRDNNSDGVIDTCYCTITSNTDTTCNNVDDNCNGYNDEGYVPETTTCGYGACRNSGTTSCNAGSVVNSCQALFNSTADTNCNGYDEDCDGTADNNYVPTSTQCGFGPCQVTGNIICSNGALSTVCNPDTSKITSDDNCNNIDDNCDGSIDNEFTASTTTCGKGVCASTGVTTCSIGGIQGNTCTPKSPQGTDNNCNNIDEDCDGTADNNYVPTSTQCGVGACATTGQLICKVDGITQDTCTPLNPSGLDDNCNGIDEDCDGTADNHYVPTSTQCGVGACATTGQLVCQNGAVKDTCSPNSPQGADDTCNNIDEDCDGLIDGNYVPLTTTCGKGVCASTGTTSCSAGVVSDSCEAGSPDLDSDTTCNNVDEDCDGYVDEEYVPVVVPCGTGECVASGFKVCTPSGLVDQCTPGIPADDDSVCDGKDNDCDGQVDEDYQAVTTSCGTGSCAANGQNICYEGGIVNTCEPGSPFSEICDGVDNDCDGNIDEGYPIAKTCGVGECASTGEIQCNSGSLSDTCTPGTPAADDSVCDGKDNDCDGQIDEDYQSVVTTCGVGYCKRNGFTSCVNGNVVDSCVIGTPKSDTDNTCDNVDDNCDGTADEDYPQTSTTCGTGVCASTGTLSCVSGSQVDSCQSGSPNGDDNDCNGFDNNCNGNIDENYQSTASSCSQGLCTSTGFVKCNQTTHTLYDTCVIIPTTIDGSDLCDGIDNDCDGELDEDHESEPIECGVGYCKQSGTIECISGSTSDVCLPKLPLVGLDTCDNVDSDCDGYVDEDFQSEITTCGKGVCTSTGITQCNTGVTSDTCSPSTPPVDIDSVCDGLDNDCDGYVDEDYVPTTGECGVGYCKATGSYECINGVVTLVCIPKLPLTGLDICDNIDSDCDGSVDEDFQSELTTCGKGVCTSAGVTECKSGIISDTCLSGEPSSDIDQCDGFDNDCDGYVDEDHELVQSDCGIGGCYRIGHLQCNSGLVESDCIEGIPLSTDNDCDGVDDNCNGEVDEGYVPTATSCGTGACLASGTLECISGSLVDTCEERTPSDDANCDGIDNDCNGEIDEDYVSESIYCTTYCNIKGNTYCTADGVIDDCVIPNDPDICDGLDNDCDGEIDENFISEEVTCGLGVCFTSIQTECVDGAIVDTCSPLAPESPTDNVCDGLDNDCDGYVDEDYLPRAVTCGLGVCSNTVASSCIAGSESSSCTPSSPQSDTDNVCDGLDNDCDGYVDEEYTGITITCGLGVCRRSITSSCVSGVEDDTCSPLSPPSDTDNVCDGLDSDCDGYVDEEFESFLSPDLFCDKYQCNRATIICENGIQSNNCEDFFDTDEDGVPDNCDRCVGFDDFIDSDNDTIPDGCDICKGFNDLEDIDRDGVPDGCNDVCGLGVICTADKGCVAEYELNCADTSIGTCAISECVSNGCVIKQYSSDYQLTHYFVTTSNGNYSLYRLLSQEKEPKLIGGGVLGVGVVWSGISFNKRNNELYGIDSKSNVYKISVLNGGLTIISKNQLKGVPLDIAFHPDGTCWILSLDEDNNQYIIYKININNNANDNNDNDVVQVLSIPRVIDIVAFTWDSYGYSLYIVSPSGSYYRILISELNQQNIISIEANELCFAFTNLTTNSAFSNGIMITTGGIIYTGWSFDANKIGISLIDSRDCIGNNDTFNFVNLTSVYVVYTAIESCYHPTSVNTNHNPPPLYPGTSTNSVVTSYATTGVTTSIAVGFVGICAIFAILVAVNSTKSKEEVPLDTLLETSEANAVAHDNAIYLNGVSTLQNTMYT